MGNSLKKDASEAGDSLNDKRKQLESEKPKVPFEQRWQEWFIKAPLQALKITAIWGILGANIVLLTSQNKTWPYDKLLEKQKFENIDLSERLKKLGRPEGKVLNISQKKIAVTPWFSVTVNENKLKKLNNADIDTLIEAVTNYLKSNVEKCVQKNISDEDIELIKIQKFARTESKKYILIQTERKKFLYELMNDRRVKELLKDGKYKAIQTTIKKMVKDWK